MLACAYDGPTALDGAGSSPGGAPRAKEMYMRGIESDFYDPSPLLRQLQVLAILARAPEISQKEIARQVGLAPSMVHNYIHALAGQGYVQFEGENRRRLRYVVTDVGRRRIEALAARHLAEAGRLMELIASRARWEIERAAKDGVRSLGVVAKPALTGALIRVAADSGVEVRPLAKDGLSGDDSYEGAALEGLDGVLFAEDLTREDVSEAARRCQEEGLRVYSLA